LADRFIGLQYPLMKTPRGLLAQKKGIDQIKADVIQLILTNPGERVMIPEYGTPLRQFIFEPNDEIVRAQVRQVIAQSLADFEPRVEIENVEITNVLAENGRDTVKNSLNPDDPKEDIENILLIKIKIIDPEDIATVNELVLELPLAGESTI
jgi:phage baseplate assembly protein W